MIDLFSYATMYWWTYDRAICTLPIVDANITVTLDWRWSRIARNGYYHVVLLRAYHGDLRATSTTHLSTTTRICLLTDLTVPSTRLTDSRYIPSDDVLANVC